jgi:hypothetical protein
MKSSNANILNNEFYYAVSLNENSIYPINSNQYIYEFLDKSKICEYKVKLIKYYNLITKNEEDSWMSKRVHEYEILEILTQKNNHFLTNNIGDKISASNYLMHCDKLTNMLSNNPECFINDEGCINCSGCYTSLVIPWNKYLEINNKKDDIKPIKINQKKIFINPYSHKIDFNIRDEYYEICQKSIKLGYINENEFIEINDINVYKTILSLIIN